MSGKLARQTSDKLALSKTQERQQRFLGILAGLQAVMRQEMIPAEQALWLRALDSYEIEEIQEAVGQFVAGSGNKFLPRPGEIAETILANRLGRALDESARKTRNEMNDLQSRRDAGEKFHGLADVLAGVKKLGKIKIFDAPKKPAQTYRCPGDHVPQKQGSLTFCRRCGATITEREP